MKVTKLIREYVEEQVSKVYDAKQSPYAEQAKLDKQMIKDFENDLHKQQRELIETFLAKNQLLDRYHNYQPLTTVSTHIPCFYYAYTQAMIDDEKWESENRKLKKDKIREIMLNLELGANRQELNEMIAKLMEDAND